MAGIEAGLDSGSRAAFLALIAAQAAHSVEEYAFRLFDVLAPARFVSAVFGELFGADLATGFALANAAIVLLGVSCYIGVVRPRRPAARAVAWFWTVLELANAVGHLALAASRGSYFPGLATAPLLLGVSSYLGYRLAASAPSS